MDTTARAGRITVDLLEYKQPWLSYCERNQTTASEAFRLVVARLVGEVSSPGQDADDTDQAGSKVRVEVRLSRSERKEALGLAQAEGFALSRWIAAIVRARLGRGAQLGQLELELLARSNMQMLALCRTLQQLARACEASPLALRTFNAREVELTAALVKEHAKVVAQVISKNTSRWSEK
jgi:hypothetical protein